MQQESNRTTVHFIKELQEIEMAGVISRFLNLTFLKHFYVQQENYVF